MLIQKQKYDKGDVICMKLVNGDEIVAKVLETSDTGFKVSRPCTVLPSPKGIGLVQSMFCADINTDVEIKLEHILMHSPVIKEMVDHYLQTTTGIQTVSKGGLVMN